MLKFQGLGSGGCWLAAATSPIQLSTKSIVQHHSGSLQQIFTFDAQM
jgi:hypothetical protein